MRALDQTKFRPIFHVVININLHIFYLILWFWYYFAENGVKRHFGENTLKIALIGAKESKLAKFQIKKVFWISNLQNSYSNFEFQNSAY